jgi:hypothetical protein
LEKHTHLFRACPIDDCSSIWEVLAVGRRMSLIPRRVP